jgi:OmpA-OmpF porin, OOP family
LLVLACVGVLSVAFAPSAAAQQPPPTPSARDLLGSVRPLEPRIRVLEPEVRSLRTEKRGGGLTTVTINSDVLFDFDSADLTPAALQVVTGLVPRIDAGGATVVVVGHTDGIGSAAYNQSLSERRAAAVVEALRPTLGGRTITSEGRSSSEPVAPETINGADNPAGRAQNRRVEISFEERP